MMPQEVQQALLDMQLEDVPTKEKLKNQYRALAKIHQPRKVGDPEGPMKVLNNARDIIAAYIERPFQYAEVTPSASNWREGPFEAFSNMRAELFKFHNPEELKEWFLYMFGDAAEFKGEGYSSDSEYVEGQWVDP